MSYALTFMHRRSTLAMKWLTTITLAVCEASVNTDLIEKHWATLVHLATSVMSGNASAVAALARFGLAARGEPVYEAGVQLGRLLGTAFLADYFAKTPFRQALRRVLNCGEAVNALKRTISIPVASARRRPNVPTKCRRSPTA